MKRKQTLLADAFLLVLSVICVLNRSDNTYHMVQGEEQVEGDGPTGPRENPRVALTFDDGPKAGSTEVLLEGLKERDVRATFFVIGIYAYENPEIIKRIDAEGHLIGNHTYNHVDIARLSDEHAIREIEDTSDLIWELTGKPTDYVRPPFGVWQENLERKLEVIPVKWTVDPLDWTTSNVDEIVNKVVTKVQDGDIILLHDCYDSSVQAALRIVDLLLAEGYDFVTVDKLIID